MTRCRGAAEHRRNAGRRSCLRGCRLFGPRGALRGRPRRRLPGGGSSSRLGSCLTCWFLGCLRGLLGRLGLLAASLLRLLCTLLSSHYLPSCRGIYVTYMVTYVRCQSKKLTAVLRRG